MVDPNDCQNLAFFYCNNSAYKEYYDIQGSFEEGNWEMSTFITQSNSIDYNPDDTYVPSFSVCSIIRIDYCWNDNYQGHYFTDDITGGTDLAAGANFPLDLSRQAFALEGSNYNTGSGETSDLTLCGDPVVFYCNDPTLKGYYISNNAVDGTQKDVLGGNIVYNDSLCGDTIVDLYCSDTSYVGYYNTNSDGIADITFGQDTGNVSDPAICGDTIIRYCTDPAFDGYYSSDTVGSQRVGNIIDDESACGDLAVFYCSDDLYLGYYSGNNVQSEPNQGTQQDNSTENCACRYRRWYRDRSNRRIRNGSHGTSA
jgi:hypothetical protein